MISLAPAAFSLLCLPQPAAGEQQVDPKPHQVAPIPAPEAFESETEAPRVKGTFVSGWWKERTGPLPMATRWGLGVTLGFTSGIGLSARRHFDSGLGFHVGGIGFWTPGEKHVNLAAELLYTFRRGKVARFYGLAGVMWLAQDYGYRSVDSEPGKTISKTDYLHKLFFGPGIGVEIHMHPRFSTSLELPLVIGVNDVGGSQGDRTPEERFSLYPGLNGSIHLYF